MRQLVGTLITPTLTYPGYIAFSQYIEALRPLEAAQDSPGPGSIDLHVHGGGEADCMQGEEAVRKMARFHARHGTSGKAGASGGEVGEDPDRPAAACVKMHLQPGLYQHYKGRYLARHSETEGWFVVYETRYGVEPETLWVRPLAMFLEGESAP